MNEWFAQWQSSRGTAAALRHPSAPGAWAWQGFCGSTLLLTRGLPQHFA